LRALAGTAIAARQRARASFSSWRVPIVKQAISLLFKNLRRIKNPHTLPTFCYFRACAWTNGYYESVINNIFANNVGTARIYTTFSGITTVGNQLTLPTIFQRNEDALPFSVRYSLTL
jgi:hypothetical protein